MGWEQRGNHRYYYRKERQGSSVHSVYIGKGPLAESIAHLDQLDRDERKLKSYQKASATAEMKAPLELTQEAIDASILLLDPLLVLGGGYQHQRQWRRANGKSGH